ncbi:MAG: hypothetical protein NFCOHLIN_00961 [Gammaproteobacteria bacterium]|nr:hypothetical protein [Gammaproteobacteria bacterium]
MDAVDKIALSMGVGWASGINLYAAVFMLGFMGMNGYVALPPDLAFLADPMVLTIAALMYCVEFFADKAPGVDTGWDTLHTFIRIPAGAILAMKAIGDVNQAAELAAFMVGGSLAGISHLTKAGTRVLLNTSPEPFSNWAASIGEDLAVLAGLWAALHYPLAFLVVLLAATALAVWLLPRIWRGVRAVFLGLARLLNGSGGAAGAVSATTSPSRGTAALPEP